jgi:hypothetical protein
VQRIEKRDGRIYLVADAVANFQGRSVKAQLFFEVQWPAVTGGRHREGITVGRAHGPAQPPEVSVVGNRAAGSLWTAGAHAGKTFIYARTSGALEAIPQTELSWAAVRFPRLEKILNLRLRIEERRNPATFLRQHAHMQIAVV